MNSARRTPPTLLHDATETETSSSLHLAAGLVIGVAAGGALACALLYRARPRRPDNWQRRVRDELTEQVKQLQKIVAAVAHEIERA